MLSDAFKLDTLLFFKDFKSIENGSQFTQWLNAFSNIEWVVYAKRPFAGPEAVLAYLSRYTHRVAISNSRLIAMDEQTISFKFKNYRAKSTTKISYYAPFSR